MFETEKSVVVAEAVEEPIANSVVLVDPLFACTDSAPHGEEDAIPIVPAVASLNAVEVAGRFPKSMPPILRRLVAVEEVAKVLLPIIMLFEPEMRLLVEEAPIRRLPYCVAPPPSRLNPAW